MPGVWSFVGPVYLVGVFLLVSCQSCSSSEDCWRNPRLGVLFPKSISGRSQMVLPLQRKQYYNMNALTAAVSLTCLEIRSRNEEAINSKQNRIYLLKVFFTCNFQGSAFLGLHFHYNRASVGQWWEHLPGTNVECEFKFRLWRHVSEVRCWFYPLPWEVFLQVIQLSLSTKTSVSQFQFDQE